MLYQTGIYWNACLMQLLIRCSHHSCSTLLRAFLQKVLFFELWPFRRTLLFSLSLVANHPSTSVHNLLATTIHHHREKKNCVASTIKIIIDQYPQFANCIMKMICIMKIICIMRTKPGCRSALSLQCELSQQTKVGCETRAGPGYSWWWWWWWWWWWRRVWRWLWWWWWRWWRLSNRQRFIPGVTRGGPGCYLKWCQWKDTCHWWKGWKKSKWRKSDINWVDTNLEHVVDSSLDLEPDLKLFGQRGMNNLRSLENMFSRIKIMISWYQERRMIQDLERGRQPLVAF